MEAGREGERAEGREGGREGGGEGRRPIGSAEAPPLSKL